MWSREAFRSPRRAIGATLRWGTIFKLVPERKEFSDYFARFVDRPALKRSEEKDKALGGK